MRPFFNSDTTENFELGTKFSFLDNRLQINASIYQIDWQGIPLRVNGGALPGQAQTCFAGFATNAGDAEVKGFEIESTYQLTEGLRVNLGGSYNDAELTEASPDVPFSAGDRLPSTPDYNLSAGLLYEFDLAGNPFYIRGDYTYVSEFYALPNEEGDKAGDYGQFNASAGINFDQFTVELVGHNLTDEDAFTTVDATSALDTPINRLRPRTVGLNVTYQF
jgi:outer membrane receptor protein involved in Fe transport